MKIKVYRIGIIVKTIAKDGLNTKTTAHFCKDIEEAKALYIELKSKLCK